jgi:hypothetical protein
MQLLQSKRNHEGIESGKEQWVKLINDGIVFNLEKHQEN